MSVGNPHLMEEQSVGKFASWWNAVLFLIANNVNILLFKRNKCQKLNQKEEIFYNQDF